MNTMIRRVLLLIAALGGGGSQAANATVVDFSVPYNINGIAGSSSTAALTSLDQTNGGGNHVFMTAAYASASGAAGLPSGFGATASPGDNVLQLGIHGQSDSVTISVPSGQYSSVDILALAINGGDYLTVVLDYSNGTTTTSGYLYLGDWGGRGPYSRLSLNTGAIESGFGYTDLSLATNSALVLTGIGIDSYSGLTNVLEVSGTEVASVPEPASLLLLGSGAIGVAAFRKRRAAARSVR